MKSIVHIALIASAFVLGGCSTSQNVLLAKQAPPRVVTVAQAPDAGNSPEMDTALRSALVTAGYTVRAPLAEGVRKSDEVDAIVSYVDVWRWDIVMYLQSIAIKMFDAQTGDLLVTGDWRNSALHGFQDEEVVVGRLIEEMSGKLKSATVDTAQLDEVDASHLAGDQIP
ncbi:hypothetical protein [Lysobacter sp. D1-1-M9]|uniref:hypothetical protein n=1 Tax=Novilysobacter longmucuonensis TaxID=3098603 RepID=UPI002FCC40E3